MLEVLENRLATKKRRTEKETGIFSDRYSKYKTALL